MTFDSIDLTGSTYGLTVLNTTFFPAGKEQRIHSRDVPNRHGGFATGGFVQAKDIAVDVMVQGTSTADLLAKIDAINIALDPQKGIKPLFLPAFPGRQWNASLKEQADANVRGQAAAAFRLTFHAADPIAYATSATTQNVTLDETPKAFNAPASGNFAGSTFALPVWTVRNTSASPVTAVTISNVTRLESIIVNQTLEQNEYIRVDAARGVVEFSTNGSTWTNINNKIASSPAAFPKLSGGVVNACSVAGVGTGTLAVTYRARYY